MSKSSDKLNDCSFCEGRGMHFGKSCGACGGSGLKSDQIRLNKEYHSKNK